jgi:hypothetical protein
VGRQGRADRLLMISREVVDSARHLIAESRIIARPHETTMRITGHQQERLSWYLGRTVHLKFKQYFGICSAVRTEPALSCRSNSLLTLRIHLHGK